MKIKLKRSFSLLLPILFVATVLRVYNLDKVPPELFGDEVDAGFQAYSLLKTGKDLYGQTWPTLIHSLSEYRAPLFIYSAIPSIAIFGLNEWGVRFTSVFWGLLSILGLYLLTSKLLDEKVALLAAASLSLSPWHIHYSRAAFEVTMLLAIMIFATLFFLLSTEKKYYLPLAFLLFGLTPYIYSTAALFMPIMLLLLGVIFLQKLRQHLRYVFLSAIILIFVLTPYIGQTILGKSAERFNIVSIFTSQDLRNKVILAQTQEQLPADLQRLFHNKWLIWTQHFSLNYLRSYSPEFLFLSGDPNFRHSIHELGQLYFYELILLILGIWVLFKSNLRAKWPFLGWLFIAPIPAALTVDGGFHATRNFLMLTPLTVIVGLGASYFFSIFRKLSIKYLAVGLFILAIFNIGFFIHRYFAHYPKESWRAWHYGFKEAMQLVKSHQNEYELILINNTYEPSLIRFLFWTAYDPPRFHQQFQGDRPIKNIMPGFDGFSLEGRYYFGKVSRPFEEIVDQKTLFLVSARDDITNPVILKDSRINLLKTIHSPTGEPIFYLFSGK